MFYLFISLYFSVVDLSIEYRVRVVHYVVYCLLQHGIDFVSTCI